MNKLAIAALFLVLPISGAFASNLFGKVTSVKGSAFASHNGRTFEVRSGDDLKYDTELIVEENGQVTLEDKNNQKVHLSKSSVLAIYSDSLELRSGDVWVQSVNLVESNKLKTANAIVDYRGGEAILSYDSHKGKSQLMVINGLMKLSNSRVPELNLSVAEGNFSFVDFSFEEGMPRDPTPVGEKTFNQLVSFFKGVEVLDIKSKDLFREQPLTPPAERKIASVKAEDSEKNYEKQYKEEMKKMAAAKIATPKKEVTTATTPTKTATASAPASTPLVVKIYGLTGVEKSFSTASYDIEVQQNTLHQTSRLPASVSDVGAELVIDGPVPQIERNNNFEITPKYNESKTLLKKLREL